MRPGSPTLNTLVCSAIRLLRFGRWRRLRGRLRFGPRRLRLLLRLARRRLARHLPLRLAAGLALDDLQAATTAGERDDGETGPPPHAPPLFCAASSPSAARICPM